MRELVAADVRLHRLNRAAHVDVNENNGLITLTPTEPALTERIRQAVDQSIEIIQRRVNELGLVEPTIQREGTDRILSRCRACRIRRG